MAFLHTPYSKPDDAELEPFAEAGESGDEIDPHDHASITENDPDRDKVNPPQAQLWGESIMQRVTNTITGFCGTDTCWRGGIIWMRGTSTV